MHDIESYYIAILLCKMAHTCIYVDSSTVCMCMRMFVAWPATHTTANRNRAPVD